MDDDDEPDAAPQEVWVPVTIHIPLGAMKAWNPGKCAPLSLFCGPYAIILLAQTANTVLVPVLPFLITDTGSSATAYGLLRVAFWATETVLAPLLGALSDYIGRRAVIALSLLISAAGRALLATAPSLTQMAVARLVAGLGFQARARAQFCRAILLRNSLTAAAVLRLQIALFKAYFADAAPKKKRTGAFGLIGVIQGLALAAGPGRRRDSEVWVEATRGVARLRAVRPRRRRLLRLETGRAGGCGGEQATVALPPEDDE